MTTDEMLEEIVSYKYKAYGFPYVFLCYSHTQNVWEVTWRNPKSFENKGQTTAKTINECCKKAIDFIDNNSNLFKKL